MCWSQHKGFTQAISSVLKGRRNTWSHVVGSFQFLLFSGEALKTEKLAQGHSSGRRSWGSVAPHLPFARPGGASPLDWSSDFPLRAGARCRWCSHSLFQHSSPTPAPGLSQLLGSNLLSQPRGAPGTGLVGSPLSTNTKEMALLLGQGCCPCLSPNPQGASGHIVPGVWLLRLASQVRDPPSVPSLALWSQTSSLTSLGFCFFICKVGVRKNPCPALVWSQVSLYTST